MKPQSKFYLGILVIFVLLVAVIAVVSVKCVNDNTIREAENRVAIDARAA